MLWGCSKVENAAELVGIRDRTTVVIARIDQEIAAKERELSQATDAAQRNRISYDLQRLRRASAELQRCLIEGQSWETLSDEARGRIAERMIENLSALPRINRTAFGPLTGPLIESIAPIARTVSKGQIGNQMERMCRDLSPTERREIGCP